MTREVVVCRTADVPFGQHAVFEVEGRELGIFNVRGSYHALPNACFHQKGPLCRGKVDGTWISSAETDFRWEWAYDGELVICPWHSLEFHIKTGQCIGFRKRKLRTYEVRVEDGLIKVVI
jgi:nitrite reductase/ring-hydroxylating ferredoxin subunit